MKFDNSLSKPVVFETYKFEDSRGFFREIYHKSNNVSDIFLQINHSYSLKNVLRGLHAQLNQSKFITVISGSIYDVVVDIRRNSSTFGKWENFYLDNTKSLYVPNGFAHGFVSLEPVHLVYQVTEFWKKENEIGIKWNDLDLNIEWNVLDPVISEKDNNNMSFKEFCDNENFINW